MVGFDFGDHYVAFIYDETEHTLRVVTPADEFAVRASPEFVRLFAETPLAR